MFPRLVRFYISGLWLYIYWFKKKRRRNPSFAYPGDTVDEHTLYISREYEDEYGGEKRKGGGNVMVIITLYKYIVSHRYQIPYCSRLFINKPDSILLFHINIRDCSYVHMFIEKSFCLAGVKKNLHNFFAPHSHFSLRSGIPKLVIYTVSLFFSDWLLWWKQLGEIGGEKHDPIGSDVINTLSLPTHHTHA